MWVFDTIVAAWAQQAIGKAKLRHQRYSVSGVIACLLYLLYKFIDCGFLISKWQGTASSWQALGPVWPTVSYATAAQDPTTKPTPHHTRMQLKLLSLILLQSSFSTLNANTNPISNPALAPTLVAKCGKAGLGTDPGH